MMTTIVQVYGDEPGFGLLKAIHRNVAQYTRSGGDPSLLAGRGEAAIGVSFANDVVERARKGFPIRFVAPKDGAGFEIGAISLVKGAPNRQSALRQIDWAPLLARRARGVLEGPGGAVVPGSARP